MISRFMPGFRWKGIETPGAAIPFLPDGGTTIAKTVDDMECEAADMHLGLLATATASCKRLNHLAVYCEALAAARAAMGCRPILRGGWARRKQG